MGALLIAWEVNLYRSTNGEPLSTFTMTQQREHAASTQKVNTLREDLLCLSVHRPHSKLNLTKVQSWPNMGQSQTLVLEKCHVTNSEVVSHMTLHIVGQKKEGPRGFKHVFPERNSVVPVSLSNHLTWTSFSSSSSSSPSSHRSPPPHPSLSSLLFIYYLIFYYYHCMHMIGYLLGFGLRWSPLWAEWLNRMFFAHDSS